MKENIIQVLVCPECKRNIFIHDDLHHETYCFNCGLTLKAPYTTDFKPSGYAKLKLKLFEFIPQKQKIM